MTKYVAMILLGIAGATNGMAQKETYDLVSFTAPQNWTKDISENGISFIHVKNRNWCRINILKSTISKGSIELDFENEWQGVIVRNYTPTEVPLVNEVREING